MLLRRVYVIGGYPMVEKFNIHSILNASNKDSIQEFPKKNIMKHESQT